MKVGSEDGGDSCSTQRLSITPCPALGSSMTLAERTTRSLRVWGCNTVAQDHSVHLQSMIGNVWQFGKIFLSDFLSSPCNIVMRLDD